MIATHDWPLQPAPLGSPRRFLAPAPRDQVVTPVTDLSQVVRYICCTIWTNMPAGLEDMSAIQQRPKRSLDLGVIANAAVCTFILAINLALLIAGFLAVTGLAA